MSKIICLTIIIICTFGFAQERVVANPQISKLETRIAQLENQITELKKLLQKNDITKKSADFTPDSRVWLEGTMGWTQTGDSLYSNTGTANVGIGTSNPTQRLDINGAIKIGANVENADSTGAIRWDGSHFGGYNGTAWVVLERSGGMVLTSGDIMTGRFASLTARTRRCKWTAGGVLCVSAIRCMAMPTARM